MIIHKGLIKLECEYLISDKQTLKYPNNNMQILIDKYVRDGLVEINSEQHTKGVIK